VIDRFNMYEGHVTLAERTRCRRPFSDTSLPGSQRQGVAAVGHARHHATTQPRGAQIVVALVKSDDGRDTEGLGGRARRRNGSRSERCDMLPQV
jgi:hypothetical protein